MSLVYISFQAEINAKTVQNLLGVSFDQINKGATHLYFLFSTPGGEVQYGVAAYNVLKGLPVKTTMHNAGAVDSIGNAIFLAGKERIACAHSTFMFHGVGLNVPVGVRLEEKNLKEQLESIKADQRKIGGIIANETALQGADVDGLFLEAQTKDATFALDKKIISKIADISIPQGATLLQLVF
jgi:ATP-dependent protease ClpP protease subunit